MSLNKFTDVQKGLDLNLDIGSKLFKVAGDMISINNDLSETKFNLPSQGNNGEILECDGAGNLVFVPNSSVNGTMYSEYRSDNIVGDGTAKNLFGLGAISGINTILPNSLLFGENVTVCIRGIITYTGNELFTIKLLMNAATIVSIPYQFPASGKTNVPFLLEFVLTPIVIGVNSNLSIYTKLNYLNSSDILSGYTQNSNSIGAVDTTILQTIQVTVTMPITVNLVSAQATINKYI